MRLFSAGFGGCDLSSSSSAGANCGLNLIQFDNFPNKQHNNRGPTRDHTQCKILVILLHLYILS